MADNDPGNYNILTPVAGLFVVGTVPTVQTLISVAQIPPGGIVTMSFNIDATPILDVLTFADQKIDISLFLAIAAGAAFHLLNNAVFASGTPNVETQPLLGQRLAGSVLLVQFQNNTAVATTVCELEATVRSS